MAGHSFLLPFPLNLRAESHVFAQLSASRLYGPDLGFYTALFHGWLGSLF